MRKDCKKELKRIVMPQKYDGVIEKLCLLEDFCVLDRYSTDKSNYISIAKILNRYDTDIQLEQIVRPLTTGKYTVNQFLKIHENYC